MHNVSYVAPSSLPIGFNLTKKIYGLTAKLEITKDEGLVKKISYTLLDGVTELRLETNYRTRGSCKQKWNI